MGVAQFEVIWTIPIVLEVSNTQLQVLSLRDEDFQRT